MFQFLLVNFLLLVRPRMHVIDQELIDFSNLVGLAGLTALVIPNLKFRQNNSCNDHSDCFGFKKCCQVYYEKFCCDPDNYIKIEPKLAFTTQRIQNKE
tara:strand:+ start:1350 stop:1643 length:294 start_codon:yes stop_codon:yes gene_type:complete